MRRSRLTHAERLDVGLLLGLIVVACLGLTWALRFNGLPALYAPAKEAEVRVEDAGAAPVFDNQASIEILPLIPEAVPEVPVGPARPRAVPAIPAKQYKIYGGRKYVLGQTLRLQVTAYAPDPRCTWPYPGTTTASGMSVKTNGGKLVAADTGLIPLYSLVSVPGYAGGAVVPVLDRGNAIKGHRLDVLLPTYEQAKVWGSRTLSVQVYVPAK